MYPSHAHCSVHVAEVAARLLNGNVDVSIHVLNLRDLDSSPCCLDYIGTQATMDS